MHARRWLSNCNRYGCPSNMFQCLNAGFFICFQSAERLTVGLTFYCACVV